MNVVDYYTVLRRYIIDGVCLFVFVGLHGNYNNDYVIVRRRRRRKEIDINLHTSHTHTHTHTTNMESTYNNTNNNTQSTDE